MLARGLKNKDIQFFFNRPDRPVNSGRISTIRSGSYSDSSKISAVSDEELEAFLRHFHKLAKEEIHPNARSIVDKARTLFRKSKDGTWKLEGGEHEECECKVDFDPKKMTAIVKAIAALANNKGGYIFFGIANAEFKVGGVGDLFTKTDIVQIVEKVKAHLSPTPTIAAKETLDLDGCFVGLLHVTKHPNPPVIVYRDGDGLNEGEILFRYPGQSSRIKFGDLRAMLDERDRLAQSALARAAGQIADIGTRNAMILDTNRNVLEDGGRSILIDKELVDSLKFIKEGDFDEKLGAPTLRLVGEVTPVTVKGSATTIIAHAAVFQESILDKFLKQERVDAPIEYIYAGLAQSRMWLPIFYYSRMCEKSNDEIAALVRALKVAQKGKKRILVDRLELHKSAFAKAVTKASKRWRDDIAKGIVTVPTTVEEAALFAQGVTGVGAIAAKLEALLKALAVCRTFAEAADHGDLMGLIFKAASRVDELFFAKAD
ncbi:ATP-binding protein [Bradyrhizobium symbiodeficiens]|uniref:ATP-binding protein n=1 Tax=Bradyrhizobium symbiodeficiens TaxID=1404367 RepID=A0ABX5WAX0_9BRAD|nr:ATP-binding protein [Bradyrhizobium symbiodeficiens]